MLFSHCRVTVPTSTRAHMFYIVNVSFLRIVYRVKKNNVFRVRVSVALSCHTCHTCTSNVCTTFERHTRVRVVWRVHVGFRKRVTVFDYCVIFCQLEVTTRRNFNSLFFYRLHPLRVGIKKKGKILCTGGFRIRVKFSDRSVGKRWKWKTVFRWHCSFFETRVREISAGKCGPLMAVKRTTTKGPPQKGRCPRWIHLGRPVYYI